MPAFSTAARYEPKWYADADTSGCIRLASCVYDRSFPSLCSFFKVWRIWLLSQLSLAIVVSSSESRPAQTERADASSLAARSGGVKPCDPCARRPTASRKRSAIPARDHSRATCEIAHVLPHLIRI